MRLISSFWRNVQESLPHISWVFAFMSVRTLAWLWLWSGLFPEQLLLFRMRWHKELQPPVGSQAGRFAAGSDIFKLFESNRWKNEHLLTPTDGKCFCHVCLLDPLSTQVDEQGVDNSEDDGDEACALQTLSCFQLVCNHVTGFEVWKISYGFTDRQTMFFIGSLHCLNGSAYLEKQSLDYL